MVKEKGVGDVGVAPHGAPATVRERVAAEERPATNGHVEPRPATNGVVLPPPKPAAAVRISHVTKSFGRTAVFADVSFSVANGELVEITRPSRAGKTTLLRLIHDQLRPTRGQVWVRGRRLHRWRRRSLARARRA